MIDSNNIEIIRDNLKELDQKNKTIPDPSAASDGQLLTVDDGKWTIADPPKGSVVVTIGLSDTTISPSDRELIVSSFRAGLPVFIKKIMSSNGSLMYEVTECVYDGESYTPQIIVAARNVHFSSPNRSGFVELRASTPGWAIVETEYVEKLSYTTTEQNTGKKWIDGRDIYQVTKTGTLSSGAAQITLTEDIDTVVGFFGSYDIGTTKLGLNEFMTGSSFGNSWYTYTHINTGETKNIDCKCSGFISGSTANINVTILYVKPAQETKKRKSK